MMTNNKLYFYRKTNTRNMVWAFRILPNRVVYLLSHYHIKHNSDYQIIGYMNKKEDLGSVINANT